MEPGPTGIIFAYSPPDPETNTTTIKFQNGAIVVVNSDYCSRQCPSILNLHPDGLFHFEPRHLLGLVDVLRYVHLFGDGELDKFTVADSQLFRMLLSSRVIDCEKAFIWAANSLHARTTPDTVMHLFQDFPLEFTEMRDGFLALFLLKHVNDPAVQPVLSQIYLLPDHASSLRPSVNERSLSVYSDYDAKVATLNRWAMVVAAFVGAVPKYDIAYFCQDANQLRDTRQAEAYQELCQKIAIPPITHYELSSSPLAFDSSLDAPSPSSLPPPRLTYGYFWEPRRFYYRNEFKEEAYEGLFPVITGYNELVDYSLEEVRWNDVHRGRPGWVTIPTHPFDHTEVGDLEALPEEMITHVLSFLPSTDRLAARTVCRSLNQLVRENIHELPNAVVPRPLEGYFQVLTSFPNLTVLNVGLPEYSPLVPVPPLLLQFLQDHPQITSLNIRRMVFSSEKLAHAAPNLTHLVCTWEGWAIANLDIFSNLTSLDLGVEAVNSQVVFPSRLTRLKLCDMSATIHQTLTLVADQLETFEYIPRKISPKSLAFRAPLLSYFSFVPQFTRLRKLTIMAIVEGAPTTSEFLSSVGTACLELRELSFTAAGITDVALETIGAKMTSLEILSLTTGNGKSGVGLSVSGAGLSHLQRCTNLHSFGLHLLNSLHGFDDSVKASALPYPDEVEQEANDVLQETSLDNTPAVPHKAVPIGRLKKSAPAPVESATPSITATVTTSTVASTTTSVSTPTPTVGTASAFPFTDFSATSLKKQSSGISSEKQYLWTQRLAGSIPRQTGQASTVVVPNFTPCGNSLLASATDSSQSIPPSILAPPLTSPFSPPVAMNPFDLAFPATASAINSSPSTTLPVPVSFGSVSVTNTTTTTAGQTATTDPSGSFTFTSPLPNSSVTTTAPPCSTTATTLPSTTVTPSNPFASSGNFSTDASFGSTFTPSPAYDNLTAKTAQNPFTFGGVPTSTNFSSAQALTFSSPPPPASNPSVTNPFAVPQPGPIAPSSVINPFASTDTTTAPTTVTIAASTTGVSSPSDVVGFNSSVSAQSTSTPKMSTKHALRRRSTKSGAAGGVIPLVPVPALNTSDPQSPPIITFQSPSPSVAFSPNMNFNGASSLLGGATAGRPIDKPPGASVTLAPHFYGVSLRDLYLLCAVLPIRELQLPYMPLLGGQFTSGARVLKELGVRISYDPSFYSILDL